MTSGRNTSRRSQNCAPASTGFHFPVAHAIRFKASTGWADSMRFGNTSRRWIFSSNSFLRQSTTRYPNGWKQQTPVEWIRRSGAQHGLTSLQINPSEPGSAMRCAICCGEKHHDAALEEDEYQWILSDRAATNPICGEVLLLKRKSITLSSIWRSSALQTSSRSDPSMRNN